MKGFIELKSKNFKTVNVDSIKMIEQVRECTRLRYVFTDGSEFVEVFETEEEFQDRITVLKEVLIWRFFNKEKQIKELKTDNKQNLNLDVLLKQYIDENIVSIRTFISKKNKYAVELRIGVHSSKFISFDKATERDKFIDSLRKLKGVD